MSGVCPMGMGGDAAADARPQGPRTAYAGAPPYADYVGLGELLSLQHPRTEEPTEVSFLIASQVMELLFALLKHEWTVARDLLADDEVVEASRVLRRSVRQTDVLVNSWDLLATLTPAEFGAFREALGEASGFQSHLYRELEFLLGLKREAAVRPYAGVPAVHAELEAALHAPSLYDAALGALHRRGLPVPAAKLTADRTRPYEADPDVERAWAEVYATGTKHADLRDLGEALTDLSERWTRWRERHLAATLRALGNRPGTGGSSGAEWLERTVRDRVFPDLWTMRTAVI
ncbi:tryptophan 2,3-dioxygenase [Yinghuangia seranimata]|uniref:tryptophan 2,3-dioxygenase n=1 Tax=Yinghuangia seranimata TaxID=408067 RepID=UPI00248C5D3B|nr:tryptophan 2,3-dioxygenase family protein [Yinghuangia seranimata]MDI2127894.1 tryptophan 2,3-dioxygenase family protein [Yinghuangia seranimata]